MLGCVLDDMFRDNTTPNAACLAAQDSDEQYLALKLKKMLGKKDTKTI